MTDDPTARADSATPITITRDEVWITVERGVQDDLRSLWVVNRAIVDAALRGAPVRFAALIGHNDSGDDVQMLAGADNAADGRSVWVTVTVEDRDEEWTPTIAPARTAEEPF